MTVYVEVDSLVKTFGSFTAVDNVSFKVGKGEVLGFLGPNGAGKSTTMKMITGFLAPDSGTIRVASENVQEKPVHAKRRIGYLPEGAPLYPDMTPRSMLDFIASIRGLRGSEGTQAIERTIEMVNLESVLHQPVDTLSKGFKRRVGLAQAILHDPDILILDEPTDGLDPNQKHEVRQLIRSMADDKAIILSTHILEEVEAVCSRNIVIAGGRLVLDATPAEFEARSKWHNAVTVAIESQNNADVSAALGALKGVREVVVEHGEGNASRVTAFPKSGQLIADRVAAEIRAKGWAVSETRVERGRLDDVFRAITVDQQSRG